MLEINNALKLCITRQYRKAPDNIINLWYMQLQLSFSATIYLIHTMTLQDMFVFYVTPIE